MSTQGDLFAPPAPSVIPCHRGGHNCLWPACAPDCDGRPGNPAPESPEAPAFIRGWVHPKIAKQSPEQRARVFEKIAADYEAESISNPAQADDRRQRAKHLRALAQQMRKTGKVLA